MKYLNSLKSIKSLIPKRDLTLNQKNKLLQKCLDEINQEELILKNKMVEIFELEKKCRDKILGADYWREAIMLNDSFPTFYPQLDQDEVLRTVHKVRKRLHNNTNHGGKTKKRKTKKRITKKRKLKKK